MFKDAIDLSALHRGELSPESAGPLPPIKGKGEPGEH